MASTIGLTQYLALLIGVYLIAASLGFLRLPETVDETLKGLKGDRVLGLLIGVMTLTIGGAVIGLHNRWDGGLAVIVTLIGWAILIKGLLLLAFRDFFLEIVAELRLSHPVVRVISALCVIAGGLLIIAAFA